MGIIRSFLNIFTKEKKEEALFNVKAMQGMVPGGRYAGIGFIPGDLNGKWIKGEESICGICSACNEGKLFYYWQEEYYRLQCEKCNYLHDVGMKYSPEIVKQLNKED